jgi:uncharacterized protein
MKELIIDTNLLISFVTDRHPAQQEKATELFLRASRGKARLLCPQSVIIEFVYVLEKVYRQPKEQIRRMVADFIAWPGVQVVQEIDLTWVLRYWPGQITDFGDALVAAVAAARKDAQVATFDKRLMAALTKVGLHPVTW